MKRKLAWFALPLVLFALIWSVKWWSLEHPPTTDEDLAVRALMSRSEAKVFDDDGTLQGNLLKADAEALASCFHTTLITPPWRSPSTTHHIDFVFDMSDSEEVSMISLTIDPDNDEGEVAVIYSEEQMHQDLYQIHPVTVKRWKELLLANPRISAKLHARIKSSTELSDQAGGMPPN